MKNSKPKNQSWKKDYNTMLGQSLAESTRKAYARDIAYFWSWVRIVKGRRRIRYPVDEDIIMHFSTDHLNGLSDEVCEKLGQAGFGKRRRKFSPDSVNRVMCALAYEHYKAGKPSPFRFARYKKLIRVARKTMGDRPRNRKEAITLDILEQLLETCDNSLHGIRDRALLLTGFASGGRRRCELAKMCYEHLHRVPDGYLIRLDRSKNNRSNDEIQNAPALGIVANAIDDWLLISEIRSGPIFRGINHRDHSINGSITGDTINRMIKRRIKMIGLDPTRYGGHSLRSGFMTECGRQGHALGDAMQLSTHKTFDTAHGYYRNGDVLLNPATRLVEKVPCDKTRRTMARLNRPKKPVRQLDLWD